MSASRIDMHNVQELVRLHRQGRSAREIARLLQISRNTVRTYLEALRSAGLLEGPAEDLPELAALRAVLPRRHPPQEVSTVASSRGTVVELVAKGASPGPIFDALRTSDPDFRGSRSAVKRLCARVRKDLGPAPADVVLGAQGEGVRSP